MTVAMSDRAPATQSPRSPADRSISVIVTAMNEEGNLRPAVEAVACAVAPRFLRYEIIIVDDGSTDRTPEVARSLVAGDARIRVHRNVRNLGVGRSYRIGIDLASYEYTSWVAGNNMLSQEALERVYDRVGERDMVISYILHDVRPWRRRVVSPSGAMRTWLLIAWSCKPQSGQRYVAGFMLRTGRIEYHSAGSSRERLRRVIAGRTRARRRCRPAAPPDSSPARPPRLP